MNVVYGIIMWLTLDGATTGVFEEVLSDNAWNDCQQMVGMMLEKAAEDKRATVAKCTTDITELGRLIEKFSLVEVEE